MASVAAKVRCMTTKTQLSAVQVVGEQVVGKVEVVERVLQESENAAVSKSSTPKEAALQAQERPELDKES